ncbi:MAG: endonuclease [Desulfurococcaceae archaeon]
MASALVMKFSKEECVWRIENAEACEDLEERWIGKRHGDECVLSDVEAAYLLLSGEAVLSTDNGRGTFSELLEMSAECLDDAFWPRLIVYKDLRDRGRRVRPLEARNELLVRDKHGRLRLVLVLEENNPYEVNGLLKFVERSKRNGLEPVVAIVSLQGDLTYYELSEAEPTGAAT